VTDQLWVVRAGEKARYADDFRNGSFIAIGFEDFFPGDLEKITDQALRARARNPAQRTSASQLAAFAYHLDVGDYVIVPLLPKKRSYLVGRVTGPYSHVALPPQSGPHRRSVTWLGMFPREGLSAAATNTLGAIQTIFRPTAVEAELRGLITGLSPIAEPTVSGPKTAPSDQRGRVSDSTSETFGPPVQLDIEVDGEGRARITCGHPALEMEQTPRHLDPGARWSSVPGIYVLTGTELEHAAVRTGKERTLTTTLIVRPWAYVGLSEDFLGRLSSHRQGKPEWRRALLVRSGAVPFSSDDIKYLERHVYDLLAATGEVQFGQSAPRGNLSARPRNPAMLEACATAVVAVLRLTGTLI
jgi:hypothetical protein